MNDNEKAATFIGWREGQLGGLCRFDDSNRVCQLGTKHCYFDHSKYPEPAPDMSDPRNYMKALDSQMSELVRDYEGWHCDLTKLWRDEEGTVVVKRWHKTAGEAVISALAALYDAEHK